MTDADVRRTMAGLQVARHERVEPDCNLRIEDGRVKPATPREIEVKLEIDPTQLASLKTTIRSKLGDGSGTEDLVSVYYDTRKQVLRANGLSLRIRTAGERRLQTVKAARGGGAGLFDRAEWETEIDGQGPDAEALAKTPVADVLATARSGLKPMFETKIARTGWLVETKRSRIEIALDEGAVVAGAATLPLSELEFELKRGQPADLFKLMRKLDGVAVLRTGVLAKSERGYALLEKAPRAFKAEPIRLTPDMTTATAFGTILHSCVRQFRLNEPLVVERRAMESLHQARVGMRRLRSALSLFEPVVSDGRFEGLKTKLRDASRALGDARNLDVYLVHCARPEFERDRAEPGAAAFLAEIERRRTAAYDRIGGLLAAKPFRRTMIDLLEWIEVGPWRTETDPIQVALRDRPIGAFARDVLEDRRRAVVKKSRHLAELEPDARHRVRIAAKKLRYAGEFFAGLAHTDKQRERHAAFVKALQALQEHLGDLNDIQTGHEIAVGFAEGTPTPALFAAAHVSGAQDIRIAELLAAAAEARRNMVDAKRFWTKWGA